MLDYNDSNLTRVQSPIIPSIFDSILTFENTSLEPLLRANDVVSQQELYRACTSSRLQFGSRVDLHSPPTFQPGSSVSHLNKSVYGSGSDFLMVPSTIKGRAVGSVAYGAETLWILKAMGWNLTIT